MCIGFLTNHRLRLGLYLFINRKAHGHAWTDYFLKALIQLCIIKKKKENKFYVNIACCLMKQISSLFVVVYKWIQSQSTFPILQTTHLNNFFFSRMYLNVGRWEISGSSEQDALSKIRYVFMGQIEFLWTKHEECGAYKTIMYLSIAVWNKLSQGRVNSQALQVSSWVFFLKHGVIWSVTGFRKDETYW